MALKIVSNSKNICTVDVCSNSVHAKGLCDKHYRRMLRHGTAEKLKIIKYCKRGHLRTPENVNKSGGCKTCKKEYQDRYREENKEKIKERDSLYYLKNKEKIKAIHARYNKEKPEKVNECSARYRAKNPEKTKERSARYRKENKEKIDEYSVRCREELSDSYVNRIMRISVKDVPNELIECKRLNLQIKRKLKNEKH